MNKILTVLVASFTAISVSAQEKTWSLSDCIAYARENNISVQQAKLTAESSKVDIKQSKAALFPTLTFSTTQQLGFQKIESQDLATNVTGAKNPTYTGSYGINANVTLFDGGANWRTIKSNKLSHEADELNAEKTANSIELRIIQAYYQILYAHEAVTTNEEIVKVAEKELTRTQELLKVGKGSKVDVAQMESQYQQNQYTLVNARNTEAANILALKQLLQLGTEEDFSIDYVNYGTQDVMGLIPTVEDAQAQALANLPDVKAAEADVQVAELKEKIAAGGYYPTLSLGANITTSNGNTYSGDFSQQVKDHLRETIALTLSVPIWDGYKTRGSVSKARINTANAELALADTRLELNNTIADLHLDIQSAQARYQSAVTSEAAAKESFELMEGRYNVGLESIIDLLTEKNKYLQARQETLQSKYTALLNLRLMDFYTGNQ